MSQLAQCILSQAQSLPEGGLLSPKEFLHLGSRAAIDQTLSRLAREGKLLRVGRGAYSLPVQGRFGVRLPRPKPLSKRSSPPAVRLWWPAALQRPMHWG